MKDLTFIGICVEAGKILRVRWGNRSHSYYTDCFRKTVDTGNNERLVASTPARRLTQF